MMLRSVPSHKTSAKKKNPYAGAPYRAPCGQHCDIFSSMVVVKLQIGQLTADTLKVLFVF